MWAGYPFPPCRAVGVGQGPLWCFGPLWRFAMEQLINKVLSQGSGQEANLEIQVFGGGKINSALYADVGAKNIEFVRQFLADEG